MANVLITGSGIGIGRATAIAFARAGYAVMATDILNQEGAGLVDEIRNGGGIAEFFHLDVTDTARTNELVAEATKRHGALEVVVANAGIAHRIPFAKMTEEHSQGEAGLRRATEYIPLGRVGDPADIADVVVFLASGGARYVTGQTIVVDGGIQVGRY